LKWTKKSLKDTNNHLGFSSDFIWSCIKDLTSFTLLNEPQIKFWERQKLND
jgi:hypothetical protein